MTPMFCGYQVVYDKSFQDAINYAEANGFDYVSYDLSVPQFYIDQLDFDELDKIREYAESSDIGLAFHAPGDNISLFADYPAIRQGILDHFSAIIKAAEYLNARHIVVHPGAYPSFKQANKKEDDFLKDYENYFGEVLYDNLSYLVEQTKNTMLCIENYQLSAPVLKCSKYGGVKMYHP